MRPEYIYPRKELNIYADRLVKRDHDVELVLITGVRKGGVTSIVSYDKAVLSYADALHLTTFFKYYDMMPPGSPSSGSTSLKDRSIAFASHAAKTLLDLAKIFRIHVSLPFDHAVEIGAEVEYAKGQKLGDSYKNILRALESYVKGLSIIKELDRVAIVFDHVYIDRENAEKFIGQVAYVASNISKQTGAKTVAVFVVRPNVFDAFVNSDMDGRYNIPTSYGIVGLPSLSEFERIIALHGFQVPEEKMKKVYEISGGNPFVAIEYFTYLPWRYEARFLQSIDMEFNVEGVILNAKKQGLLPKLLHIVEDPDAAEDFPKARALLMKEGLLCRADYSSVRLFMKPENVKTKYFWASPLVAEYIGLSAREELSVASRGTSLREHGAKL